MPTLFLTSSGILSDATTGLSQVITWVGTVIDALVGTDGALGPLWPLIGVSIGISVLLLGIKVLKGFTWGM